MIRLLLVLLVLILAGCEYNPYTPPSVGHQAEMDAACKRDGYAGTRPSRLPGGLECRP